MYSTAGTPERARWAVIWIDATGHVYHPFDHDFGEAVKVYTEAVKAGRKNVTLQCVNMAFAPSEKYADSETVVKKFRNKATGKIVKKEVQVPLYPLHYQVTMGRLNAKGIWWCPFCVKLRRFERIEEHEVEGVIVYEVLMLCPMCAVSNNHGSVRKYNPHASRDYGRRTRSDKGYVRG